MNRISAILAIDEANGIGKNGTIPWHVPEDFKYFKKYTKNSLCVMGKNTFFDVLSHRVSEDSPFLPERNSVVITRQAEELSARYDFKNVTFFDQLSILKSILQDPLSQFVLPSESGRINIIGGKSIYEQMFDIVDEVSVTRIKGSYDCDVTFPLQQHLRSYKKIREQKLGNTENVTEIYVKERF